MDRKVTFISIGVIFWICAALLMHFIVPYVFDGGLIQILFWVANFFFPAIAIPLIAKLTQRTKHDMLAPTVLFAITFDTMGFTHIYADNAILAGYTGGFLLFALASFFIWAIFWHHEPA